MKKKIILLALVVILFVSLAGCTTKNGREPAPDFSWKDTGGSVVKLSNLKDRVVLIDFWATWCGPCKMTIPHVEAIYNKYKEKGVLVLGISVDDSSTAGNVPSFIKENGMDYLVVNDSNSTVSSLYGVSSIPRFFIIDKNGKIAKSIIGYDPNMETVIGDEIDNLLNE